MSEDQSVPRIETQIECGNCGAPIQLTVILEGNLKAHLEHSQDLAVTCDCGKTNWITLTPVQPSRVAR